MVQPYYGAPIEQDISALQTEFLLSPTIPEREKKYFERFYLMFSKISALGNIENEEIYAFLITFREICMLIEMGLYDDARKLEGETLMLLQLSRSKKGFYTLYGQHGISRTESISKVMDQQKRHTSGGRLSRLFRREKKEPQYSPSSVGGVQP